MTQFVMTTLREIVSGRGFPVPLFENIAVRDDTGKVVSRPEPGGHPPVGVRRLPAGVLIIVERTGISGETPGFILLGPQEMASPS